MTGILTNTADIDTKWARPVLKNILHKGQKAVILACSDFEDVKDQADWERDYAPGGLWHAAYEGGLKAYGITDITWLSPFRNSRKEMIEALSTADVIVLPGGAPDRFMKNIRKFGLKKTLKAHQGVFFGISAGAMILLEDYHITPDDDYDEFAWHKGLGFYNFDIEPHFKGTRHQKEHLELAQSQRGLPTYAIYEDGGLVVSGDEVRLLGNVDTYPGISVDLSTHPDYH